MGASLHGYISRARWFGGKGRDFEVTALRPLAVYPAGSTTERALVLAIATLTYLDATGGTEAYQLPLTVGPRAFGARGEGAHGASAHGEADPASFVADASDPALAALWDRLVAEGSVPRGEATEVSWHDATREAAGAHLLLRQFAEPDQRSAVRFRLMPGVSVAADAPVRPLHAEQSNSSLVWETGGDPGRGTGGDSPGSIFKLFHKVVPGINPDIELHQALTQAGCRHIAPLQGWVEANIGPAPEAPTHLGLLQQLLPAAADGWDLFVTGFNRVEGLLDHAMSLGIALADVHADLRQAALDPGGETVADGATVAAAMSARLAAAAGVVPALAPLAPRLTAVFDRLAQLPGIRLQRLHGDFHLGQTVRSGGRWWLLDFEGEPAKSLEARRRPDSVWRDVASMLRSFEYAAAVASSRASAPSTPATPATAARPLAEAFLAGYLGRLPTDEEQTLLAAYSADKAVYETVYETHNRPEWVSLPLGALAQIGAP